MTVDKTDQVFAQVLGMTVSKVIEVHKEIPAALVALVYAAVIASLEELQLLKLPNESTTQS